MHTISELRGMLRKQVMVEISSERDSPFAPVTIEEEVASMSIGSSSIIKKKRKGQNPSSLMPKKRQTRTSTMAAEEVAQAGPSSYIVVESAAHVGVSTEDILGYIPPCRPGAQPRNLTKNQKYQVRMSMIPQGMV